MSRQLNGDTTCKLSVAGLPAAIYMVNAELNNGTVSYMKLAIEK